MTLAPIPPQSPLLTTTGSLAPTAPPINPGPSAEAAPLERERELQTPINALEIAQQAFIDLGVTFEIDADSERMIIKVVDRSNGELIRQIPSEEILRIASRLETGSVTPGSLLDEWA